MRRAYPGPWGMKTVFSWLHLSDLHVRKNHYGTGLMVLDRIADGVAGGLFPEPPRAILLTGDAAFSGDAAEYERLLEALKKITSALSLSLQDVYAVPGNHDVRRAPLGSPEHLLLENIRSGTTDLDRALETDGQRSLLLDRMQAFRDFAANLARVERLPAALDGIAWCHRVDTNGGPPLRLVGLNTALLANDAFDAKFLRLGELQLHALRNPFPEEVVLVLTHHPLAWLGDEEQVSPWLETLSHVHLSGHVHVHGVKRIVTGVGLELVTVSAGAAFTTEAGGERFAFSFGAIHANGEGRRDLRVWPWAWASQKATFEPDAAALPRASKSDYVECPLRGAQPSKGPAGGGALPRASPRPSSLYRTPLVVYVVWHPLFVEGAAFARDVYDQLRGDPTKPFGTKLGIPVYYRSSPAGPESPLPLDVDFDEAEETVVVVLADANMLAHADGEKGWRSYVLGLQARCKRGRFFGVACRKGAERLAQAKEAAPSWELMYLLTDIGAQRKDLRHRLLVSLVAILDGGDGTAERRATLFLSHSTLNGGAIAKEMREQISAKWPLKVFFDKLDIPVGHDFAKVLEDMIVPAEARGVVGLVALLTDEYASRDWCQREVLFAKRAQRPMLVVHMLTRGEDRSFPYLGNVPSAVWTSLGGSNTERAEALAERMFELILHSLHMKKQLAALSRLYGLDEPVLLTRPPELLDVADGSARVLVYPDPPLTDAELSVFGEHRWRLFTPTQLAQKRAR